jgi:iron complex outermembrane receptor protein
MPALQKFLSTSSYERANFDALSDLSPGYAVLTQPILGANYGVAYPQYFDYSTFTQEARLTSAGSGPLQWQVGGYFTDNHSNINGALFPIDPPSGTILYGNPGLGAFSQPASYRESAGFANLDYEVTREFDVALGGRYSRNNQTYRDYPNGPILGSEILSEQSSQGAFTYSGDARWHVTPENMLYARIAEGFVPGGPNNTFPGSTLPSSYKSSTTINYEAGIKSTLLDNRLTVELSVFYIDWRDIALSVTIDGLSAYDNAGTARSQGAEWNFVYAPLSGLTLSGASSGATPALPASVGVSPATGMRISRPPPRVCRCRAFPYLMSAPA